MALPATDTFLQSTGSSQALSTYNASFTQQIGTFTVQSGTGYTSSSAAGVDCLAFWNADAFNERQYAITQMATGWVAAGVYGGPAVRGNSTGGGAGYGIEAKNGEWYLGRWVGAAWTTIRSHLDVGAFSAADGDFLRLQAENITGAVRLTFSRAPVATPNTFTTIAVFDDTAGNRVLSGSGGICGYDNTSSAMIGAFEAGNLAAPAAQLSHRNGIAIASISHFNGIAKASVSAINGLTIS